MKTTKNPIRDKEKHYYPINICCVLDDLSDYDENILAIRDFTNSMNILFIRREFDSLKYTDDRNMIRSLPAFHIYIQNRYFRTFYLNTRPYQHIQEALEAYKLQEKNNLRRKNRFIRWYNSLLAFFQPKAKKSQLQTKIELAKLENDRKIRERMQLNVTEW